jgi:hypothetical protein
MCISFFIILTVLQKVVNRDSSPSKVHRKINGVDIVKINKINDDNKRVNKRLCNRLLY